MRKLVLLLLISLMATPVMAQDGEDEPELDVSAWQAIRLTEEDEVDEEAEPTIVLFVTLDDGETLLSVWPGPDIVYHQTENGVYSGLELVLNETYEFEVVLEVIDESTMLSTGRLSTGSWETITNHRYERLEENDYLLFTETDRELIDYSQYGSCLGLTDVTPGTTWTRPDLLVSILIDEETSTLVYFEDTYSGDGTQLVFEETMPFGQFEQVITRTFTRNTDDTLSFEFVSIADGRDDCQTIYTSRFVPFDGDIEALFEAAAAQAEAEVSQG